MKTDGRGERGDCSLPLASSLGREKPNDHTYRHSRPSSIVSLPSPLSHLPSPISRRLSVNGFTLLEVLVALAIVGLAVTAVLELFSFNLRAISLSEDQMRASLAAEARMREILDGEVLAEKTWSEVTSGGYRVDVLINRVQADRAQAVNAELYQVNLSLSWKRGMKDKTISLRTLKAVYKGKEEEVSG